MLPRKTSSLVNELCVAFFLYINFIVIESDASHVVVIMPTVMWVGIEPTIDG